MSDRDYSELVGRLRGTSFEAEKLSDPTWEFVYSVEERAKEAATVIEALQLKLADAQASAEASARRVVRAEAVVKAARVFYTHEGCMASTPADLLRIREALDRLAEQDSEQEDRHA